jgi:mannose-6-phosphate isomerase-like protein (cupin superfamily)
MGSISNYIESGVIEMYVLGMCTPEEQVEVETLAAAHTEVRFAIDDFSEALEREALANTVPVNPLVKPMFMGTIDFMARLQNGEEPSNPPTLTKTSTVADYKEWLDRPYMALPDNNTEDIYVKIIAASPKATTAIVWIKEFAPQEVHEHEFEKFLIVEGTCTITIGSEKHDLVPGNFLAIPLYEKHHVVVTSNNYCKVILERLAA